VDGPACMTDRITRDFADAKVRIRGARFIHTRRSSRIG
jgi:hypothetical protein